MCNVLNSLVLCNVSSNLLIVNVRYGVDCFKTVILFIEDIIFKINPANDVVNSADIK